MPIFTYNQCGTTGHKIWEAANDTRMHNMQYHPHYATEYQTAPNYFKIISKVLLLSEISSEISIFCAVIKLKVLDKYKLQFHTLN